MRLTVKKIINKKYKTMAFTGEWKAGIGTPERAGTWIIWGNSSNGKSNFAMQLAKYLAGFDRVCYDSLEEGSGLSMQKLINENKMSEVSKTFSLLDKGKLSDIDEVMIKRRSPNIIIIDSLQYLGIDKVKYQDLKEKHSGKLIIFISHAEGKEPASMIGKYIRYDADVKIRIEGFKAFCQSRFGGGKPITIWEEGANDYWGN
jgi:hypothetical protein